MKKFQWILKATSILDDELKPTRANRYIVELVEKDGICYSFGKFLLQFLLQAMNTLDSNDTELRINGFSILLCC